MAIIHPGFFYHELYRMAEIQFKSQTQGSWILPTNGLDRFIRDSEDTPHQIDKQIEKQTDRHVAK